MNNNNIIVIVAILIGVVIGFVGFQAYQRHQEPKGVQINLGPNGVTVDKK